MSIPRGYLSKYFKWETETFFLSVAPISLFLSLFLCLLPQKLQIYSEFTCFFSLHSFSKPSHSKIPHGITMASGSNTKRQPHVPFSDKLNGTILRDGRTYVPKPHMEELKHVIWFSQVLIPYSLTFTAHVFMGPLPKPSKKQTSYESFFLSFSPSKPVVF